MICVCVTITNGRAAESLRYLLFFLLLLLLLYFLAVALFVIARPKRKCGDGKSNKEWTDGRTDGQDSFALGIKCVSIYSVRFFAYSPQFRYIYPEIKATEVKFCS